MFYVGLSWVCRVFDCMYIVILFVILCVLLGLLCQCVAVDVDACMRCIVCYADMALVWVAFMLT